MIKKRKKIARAMVVCVFAAGIMTGCSNPQKAGTEALEEGNYEEARELFEQVTESEDKEKAAEGYRGLGMACYELQDYPSALEAFEQAVEQGAQQSVQLCHLMSVCAMQSGDYEKALEYIQTGLGLAQTSDGKESSDAGMLREMKYNEIVCFEQKADWESAKQKAEEYLQEYPDDETVQKEAEFLKTR
mgnify:FL=1